MNHEKILQIKNLSISFRTGEGKVQAVRDISFDLYRGETLAIVGESGSGKSVTSRAILGITAGNGIHENGVILYEDKDLLQITEDDFHKIRGDKIAMVFQDPLSALNPIMRTGKQLTEAMILNNKADRRDAKKHLKRLHSNLKLRMKQAHENVSPEERKLQQDALAKFFRIQKTQSAMELNYNMAREQATEARRLSSGLSKEIERHIHHQVPKTIAALKHHLKSAVNQDVLDTDDYHTYLSMLNAFKRDKHHAKLAENLNTITREMDEILAKKRPDYFLIAESQSRQSLSNQPSKRPDDDFLSKFINLTKTTLKHTKEESLKRRQNALNIIDDNIAAIRSKPLKPAAARKALRTMSQAVEQAIEPLDIVQDSQMHTFKPSVRIILDRYVKAIAANQKEQRRYDKTHAKWQRAEAKGTADWKVPPLTLTDLEHLQDSLITIIERLRKHLSQPKNEESLRRQAENLIKHSSVLTTRIAEKISPTAAKERAIALMREVGIPEPELRFKQYPFELSGGMRQRIVIAIALSANPDILICDEPTTALDVTIQSQILELINDIKKQRGLSIIFITHDLGVVANMADRVAVMYAGKIVEIGTADEVFYEPAHPYTWALLSSMPDLDTKEQLSAIPGTPPNMIMPPVGDAFAERNHYAMQIDFEMQPPLFRISDTHYAATWLLHPDAPKAVPPAIVTERILRMKEREAAK